MKTKQKPNPRLVKCTDEELARSAEMIVAQLAELHAEMCGRGIRCSLMEYSDGSIEATYRRVVETVL